MLGSLHAFGNDEVFEQGAKLVVIKDIFFRLHAQEIAKQPGIVEIELGAFREPFPKILKVGRQAKHQVTLFQNGKPTLDGWHTNLEDER